MAFTKLASRLDVADRVLIGSEYWEVFGKSLTPSSRWVIHLRGPDGRPRSVTCDGVFAFTVAERGE